MPEFILQRDEYVHIWVHRTITVEADTMEQAKEFAYEPNDDHVTSWGVGEVLWDTEDLDQIQVYETDEEMNTAIIKDV